MFVSSSNAYSFIIWVIGSLAGTGHLVSIAFSHGRSSRENKSGVLASAAGVWNFWRTLFSARYDVVRPINCSPSEFRRNVTKLRFGVVILLVWIAVGFLLNIH